MIRSLNEDFDFIRGNDVYSGQCVLVLCALFPGMFRGTLVNSTGGHLTGFCCKPLPLFCLRIVIMSLESVFLAQANVAFVLFARNKQRRQMILSRNSLFII